LQDCKAIKRYLTFLFSSHLIITPHHTITDEDVPHKDGPFYYYSRTVEGLSYRIHCRRDSADAASPETIVLDENRLAKGHEYSDVQTMEVSPSHSLVAYAVDHRYMLDKSAIAYRVRGDFAAILQ
jgi:protease II